MSCSIIKYFLCIYMVLCLLPLAAQKKVAITIDDIPNIRQFKADGRQSLLLDTLVSRRIPAAIFINEGLLYQNQANCDNIELLKKWIAADEVTVGTHTYAHSNYSKVGIDSFRMDIIKGMEQSQLLSEQFGKEISYFRFPYNDLGSDSLQQTKAQEVLDSLELISCPFTVESSDWMFNAIYEYYIKADSLDKAKSIGEAYLAATLRNFSWMDSLAKAQYGRDVNHIYLCHDNAINIDYLPVIIDSLMAHCYEFIDLDEVLTDTIYWQKSYFYKGWGISWMYRWMTDEKERSRLMKQAPDVGEFYELYQKISSNPGY